jgi:hypothetical protein
MCAEIAFCNIGNTDSHFYVGNPYLACGRRPAPKFVKICGQVMSVLAKECTVLCLYEYFDLSCEFFVLP